MVLNVQFVYFSVFIFYNGSFDGVFLSRRVPLSFCCCCSCKCHCVLGVYIWTE